MIFTYANKNISSKGTRISTYIIEKTSHSNQAQNSPTLVHAKLCKNKILLQKQYKFIMTLFIFAFILLLVFYVSLPMMKEKSIWLLLCVKKEKQLKNQDNLM